MDLTQSEIKYLCSLHNKKYRKAKKEFLIEGLHTIEEALNSDYQIKYIAILPNLVRKVEYQQMLKLAKNKRVTIREIKEVQLNKVSDTVNSQGIIALVEQKSAECDIEKLKLANLIVVCDRISDPGNLGTIIRTCDWFGVDYVLLNEGCVSIYNEKVIRSTVGSIFHLKIFESVSYNNLLPEMREKGFKIVVSSVNGKSIFDFKYSGKDVIILGNEAQGVNSNLEKYADEVVSIPKYGKVESLNVGVACGIFLAQYRSNK